MRWISLRLRRISIEELTPLRKRLAPVDCTATMREPTVSTIKRLFALSANRCAFPKCGCPIVEETGTVTGIICHIKARSKGGPRYDSKQSDEERHAYPNLIL